jgi:hypothetical protein
MQTSAVRVENGLCFEFVDCEFLGNGIGIDILAMSEGSLSILKSSISDNTVVGLNVQFGTVVQSTVTIGQTLLQGNMVGVQVGGAASNQLIVYKCVIEQCKLHALEL